jgi:hypothetical protein
MSGDVRRLIGDKPVSHGDADVSLYDVMQDGMGVLLDATPEGRLRGLLQPSRTLTHRRYVAAPSMRGLSALLIMLQDTRVITSVGRKIDNRRG